MSEITFVKHKSKNEDKTSVWYHFLKSVECESAKCKSCGKILKTKGSSTKGLLTHLKSHNVKLHRPNEVQNYVRKNTNGSDPVPKKMRKITSHFKTKEMNHQLLPIVISRLVALDGLPFSVIVNSSELKKSLEARGLNVPDSTKELKKCVMEYCVDMRRKLKDDINKLKTLQRKFSLSFDEWISTTNKKYLSIIIHSNGEFWNTGLIRTKNTMTTDEINDIVENRMYEYNLTLQQDIVAITTDKSDSVAGVDTIIGGPNHQLCFAHGIQLAIIDIFYKKDSRFVLITSNDNEDDGDDSDFESRDGMDSFHKCNGEQYLELTDKYNLCNIVEEVRNIIRKLRKAPHKDNFKNYVQKEHGKDIPLILDRKSRWDSLYNMLERFILLESPLKSIMNDLESVLLEESEFQTLKEVVETLKPIDLTVKALCKTGMNLCSADVAMIFLLDEVRKINTSLSYDLYESLRTRIQERRTVLSTVLNFLSRGTLEISILNFDVSIGVIQSTIVNLLKRIKCEDSKEEEFVPITEASENDPLETRLAKAIANSTTNRTMLTKKSSDQTIVQEIDLFMNGGILGVNLQFALDHLMTIAPTCVECERCFTTSEFSCNMFRSSLSDEVLDSMVFLNSYLKKK